MERTGGDQETTMETPLQQIPSTTVERKREKLKVLVAMDESERSVYALKWTLDNILNNHAATSSVEVTTEPNPEMGMVTLLHVIKPFGQTYAAYASTEVVVSMRKVQEQVAADILGRAFQICTEKKIKAETLIMEGDPRDMICRAAEEMHFDLLVLGSRGLGMIKRALLGSVSDYCVHHVQCPILIVKPPKDKDSSYK